MSTIDSLHTGLLSCALLALTALGLGVVILQAFIELLRKYHELRQHRRRRNTGRKKRPHSDSADAADAK